MWNFCLILLSLLLGGGMIVFGWGCGLVDVVVCCSNGLWGCWGGLDWWFVGEEIDGIYYFFLVSRVFYYLWYCDWIFWCFFVFFWLVVVVCFYLFCCEWVVFYDCVCVEVKLVLFWWLIVFVCVGLFLLYDKIFYFFCICCCF